MVWNGLKMLFSMALILSIDFGSLSSKECLIAERNDLYYSTKASNSSGRLLRTSESEHIEECREFCCDLKQCNLMMYSTVLRDYERSTNVTCFLINCPEISKCITKQLPKNITGVSIVGIKQKDLTNIHLDSNYTNSTIEQHKIYKPPSNSTVRPSPTHPLISNKMKNTDNQLNFNITNSVIFKNHNMTKLTPKVVHSQIKFAYVPLNPMTSVSNSSYPTLSTKIPSQSSEAPARSNHSSPTLLYPSVTILNTNNSFLSTKIHSTPVRTHSPGSWTRSNNSLSHQVGQLPGSYSNGSNSSINQNQSLHKMPQSQSHHSSMSVSANPLVNSSKSNNGHKVILSSSTSAFVPSHFTTETTPSTTSNVSDLHPLNSSTYNKVSDPSHATTKSHTTKGDRETGRKFSEQQSHTTRVSLVLSLIIGILFFGTVVFLIGRRWSEQCFRRGYSRVDYLLNDYD